MKKAVLIGIISCLLGSGGLALAADMRIGYVDLEQVKETEEWKRLEDLFQANVNESQKEVDQKKKELETAALQYQRQKAMLSDEAQQEKERQLKKQQIEFQLWAQDRQKSLEKKRQEMSQQIWSRVNKVIVKIAKKRKLSLVVDYDPNTTDVTANYERGFVYLSPEVDITDEVIKEFNAVAGRGDD
jgi:Skp family chaperone for outer membrane proteins